jgi:hypothetical protein
MLIRIAEIDTRMRGTGKKLELAANMCMTLKEVDQRGKGRVKTAGRRRWC